MVKKLLLPLLLLAGVVMTSCEPVTKKATPSPERQSDLPALGYLDDGTVG